mgnify:CR=1 FL=1|jgi:hypothetical protein|nr:MAG: hypothetical protein KatS3mg041_0151 [Bacteroidota bacterium]
MGRAGSSVLAWLIALSLSAEAGAQSREMLDSLWMEAQTARFFNRWHEARELALQTALKAQQMGEASREGEAYGLFLEAALWTGHEREALAQVPEARICALADSVLFRRWLALAAQAICRSEQEGVESAGLWRSWQRIWEASPPEVRRQALERLDRLMTPVRLFADLSGSFRPERADGFWYLGQCWAQVDSGRARFWQEAALSYVARGMHEHVEAEVRFFQWAAAAAPEKLRGYLEALPGEARRIAARRVLEALREADRELWLPQLELLAFAPALEPLREADSASVAYWAARYHRLGALEKATALWMDWARSQHRLSAYRAAASWLLAHGAPAAVCELLGFLRLPQAQLKGQRELVVLLASALEQLGEREEAEGLLASWRGQEGAASASKRGAIRATASGSEKENEARRSRGWWRLFLGLLGLLPR